VQLTRNGDKVCHSGIYGVEHCYGRDEFAQGIFNNHQWNFMIAMQPDNSGFTATQPEEGTEGNYLQCL
jgi:hypothetical protein